MKKILTVFLSILLFINIFSVVSFADVPATQKAVAYTDVTWGTYPFIYDNHGKYYIIQDATGIPSGDLQHPKYFYTDDNETFFSVDGAKLFQLVLTRGIGVLLESTRANTLWASFVSYIGAVDSTKSKYAQGGVYDGNDNFLGYALNDISGCYYVNISNVPVSTNVTVDTTTNNNVKNFYDYYIDQNYECDYFTFVCPSREWLNTNYVLSGGSYVETTFTNYDSIISEFKNAFMVSLNPNDGHMWFTNSGVGNQNVLAFYPNVEYYLMDSGMGDYLKHFGISNSNPELLFSEYKANFSGMYPGQRYRYIFPYDENNNRLLYCSTINLTNGNIINNVRYDVNIAGIYEYNRLDGVFPVGDDLTVYKDYATYAAINKTETYTPSVYTTDSYNTYDNSNDNSFNGTVLQINQSQSSADTLYSTVSGDYYNYVDNGYVDTSSITNNTTTIINNYYNDANPDNPDNPDNPNNPDSPVLDEILAALLRFFNAIGEIIGTIFAGLLNMINSVLESIAGIMADLTGVTDFFGALVSWLPEPIPTVIGIGVSLCILLAVIGFLRG